ncbi:hypothetical protein BJV82DRAFT_361378 [Fennellomyces sp. T-0311]|nr:hypothetical protein BJV82DRAFT_361378 [Fennellomyces sp. T-0311]
MRNTVMALVTVEFDIPSVNSIRAAVIQRLDALTHRDTVYNIRSAFNGTVRMIHSDERRDLPNYPYEINWNMQRAFRWNLQIREYERRQRSVRPEVELQMPRVDINVAVDDDSDLEWSATTDAGSQGSANEPSERMWQKWINLLKDPGTYYWLVALGVLVYSSLKKQ